MEAKKRNISCQLQSREINGLFSTKFYSRRRLPLRSYKLKSMTNSDLHDIFLGFTSSGDKLVSYLFLGDSSEVDIYGFFDNMSLRNSPVLYIRFWSVHLGKLHLLQSIAIPHTQFCATTHVSELQIKYFETESSGKYMLFICDLIEKDNYFILGNVPDVDCSLCQQKETKCSVHETLVFMKIGNTSESEQAITPIVIESDGNLIFAFNNVDMIYVVNSITFSEFIPETFVYPKFTDSDFHLYQSTLLNNYCAMCYSTYLMGESSTEVGCIKSQNFPFKNVDNLSACILCGENRNSLSECSMLPCHSDSFDCSEPEERTNATNCITPYNNAYPHFLKGAAKFVSCKPLSYLSWFGNKFLSYCQQWFYSKRSDSQVALNPSGMFPESSVVDLSYECHNSFQISNDSKLFEEPNLSTKRSDIECLYKIEEVTLQMSIILSELSESNPKDKWIIDEVLFLEIDVLLIIVKFAARGFLYTNSSATREKKVSFLWNLNNGLCEKADGLVESGLLADHPVKRPCLELNNDNVIDSETSIYRLSDALGIIEIVL